jgi:hypothetical protein
LNKSELRRIIIEVHKVVANDLKFTQEREEDV